MSLNLARRPFVNRRPVRRIGLGFLILGAVLAAVNGYLYWDHLSGQGVAESGLQGVLEELESEADQLAAAEAQLARFEPTDLNQKIEFVNLRIRQRTFSWSRLFDLVVEALPGDVRLTSLSPSFGGGGRRGRSTKKSSDLVTLQIRGEAKSSEALLEFLDRLFAHRAFAEPDLHQEATNTDRGIIAFSISTLYRPAREQPAEVDAAAEVAAEAAAEADTEADTNADAEVAPEAE